jgi:SlyX protein
MDERVKELELRLTEQQGLLQDLSEVLYRQQQEIDLLRAVVEAVQKRLAAVEEQPTVGPEKPPHY